MIHFKLHFHLSAPYLPQKLYGLFLRHMHNMLFSQISRIFGLFLECLKSSKID